MKDNVYKVEYDLSYFGGDYNRVGTFVEIPESLVADGEKNGLENEEAVKAAFAKQTGHNPIHVVHYCYGKLLFL